METIGLEKKNYGDLKYKIAYGTGIAAGALAGGFIIAAFVGIVGLAYAAKIGTDWDRGAATEEVAKKMKQEMRK